MDLIKLKLKILKSSISIKDLANLIGIHKATLYRKINGDLDFTRQDINNLRIALNLSNEELIEFFLKDTYVYVNKDNRKERKRGSLYTRTS